MMKSLTFLNVLRPARMLPPVHVEPQLWLVDASPTVAQDGGDGPA